MKCLQFYTVLLVAVIALAVPQQASADDTKIKIENKHDKYKYEYKDKWCHFKYEVKYNTGKVKRSEKGDCSRIGRFPRFRPPSVPVTVSRPIDRKNACNSDVLGAILGAGLGVHVGSNIGDGDTAAVLVGTLLGGVLSNEIGRKIDNQDRRCIGSALEYADAGNAFEFSNPRTGLGYSLRPLDRVKRRGAPCRRFEARFDDGTWQPGLACRGNDGWTIVDPN